MLFVPQSPYDVLTYVRSEINKLKTNYQKLIKRGQQHAETDRQVDGWDGMDEWAQRMLIYRAKEKKLHLNEEIGTKVRNKKK